MEQWKEVFKGEIPEGEYQVYLKSGEERGTVIELESKEHMVNIIFGVVSAIRMLDEGIVLKGVFDEHQIQKYKKGGFANTIYEIEGGEFGKFTESIAGELYEYLGLKHYIIITMNYLIEVISEWEPQINIMK